MKLSRGWLSGYLSAEGQFEISHQRLEQSSQVVDETDYKQLVTEVSLRYFMCACWVASVMSDYAALGPVAYQAGPSVHGILQARILPNPGIEPMSLVSPAGIKPTTLTSSTLTSEFFTISPTWEAPVKLLKWNGVCFVERAKLVCFCLFFGAGVLNLRDLLSLYNFRNYKKKNYIPMPCL